jgi:hypothetical protein
MDTVWLSYDELAARLKITPASARRLVARNKHWARRIANDGRALVAVPTERLPPDTPPDASSGIAPDAGPDDTLGATHDARDDITEIVRVFAQQIERLGKDLDAMKAERDAERARAAELALQAAQTDALRAVLDVERRQAGELRAERDQAVERLDRAMERLDRAQATHVDELLILREQMATAVNDRDRLTAALQAHLALPWWRRLFV